MSVSSLNNVAYKRYIEMCGTYFSDIKEGEKYYYMEKDGTLTDLGVCLYSKGDSNMCWHDGPSWWEELRFENTSEKKYRHYCGGGGTANYNRLPFIENKG